MASAPKLTKQSTAIEDAKYSSGVFGQLRAASTASGIDTLVIGAV